MTTSPELPLTTVTVGIAAAASDAPAPRSLVDVFMSTVDSRGTRVAIDAGDAALTYGELHDAASALARRLSDLGVGAGDRVGIQVPSGTAELYVAILGVLASGAAYVPVDADDPPARATTIWERAGACAVVGAGLELMPLAQPTGSGREATVDDDAWVIFTSGSSGEPKGVAVTHRAAAAFVDAEARLWQVEETDRVLAGLSVAFDASCEEMWLAWRAGATLVPAERDLVRAGADLGPWIAERGVTVVSTVPTLAALWDDDSIAGVRLLILGGEACPPALASRLASSREVWNTYGPTEATVVTTAARLQPDAPVTIGWPLAGWQVAVVDDGGEPVPFGEPGELVIGGVGLGRYLDPDLDARRFAPVEPLGWDRAYRSGDIVRETETGLDFVGRRDDQVKLGGRRIELGEIDAQLSAVAGVRAAAAAVRKTEAGNSVLVGYVVGDVDAARVRAELAERLPHGIAPLIATLDALPRGRSGKVDRGALPWPPPPRSEAAGDLTGTAAWLAARWVEQLGPLPIDADSDFFELGGSSLAAAKLVSAARARYPSLAIADVYDNRRLGDLARRLDELGEATAACAQTPAPARRRGAAIQLGGVLLLQALAAPVWLLGALAFNDWQGPRFGPQVGWIWLIAGWLVFSSSPGRALTVAAARRLLLRGLRPGRYPRHSWLACRVWFVERLADTLHVETVAGTPWASRIARLTGARVGPGARLGTLPPPTALIEIGAGATLEQEVDVGGSWIEGGELIVGALRIGAGARIGSRALLMPGADIGAGAEIEPGSVVSSAVPAGERWAGSPARPVGAAGVNWPSAAAPAPTHRRFWRAMFALGLVAPSVLPLLAAVPGLALLSVLGPDRWTPHSALVAVVEQAPLMTATFLIAYAVLVALAVRGVYRLVRPGWHADEGSVGWALWFGEGLMGSARDMLFPLYLSLFTRPWLRLVGISIGRRTELSTAVGLNRFVAIADTSFAADDVVFAGARARDGWLHVGEIEVGNRTFLGNGAILAGETVLGDDSLVGALSSVPARPPHGTSWFGLPPLELPRVPDTTDPARTTDPPARLVAGRAATELVRILLPGSVSVALGTLAFLAVDGIGRRAGLLAMGLTTPLAILTAAAAAVLLTIAAKWLVIGRYRRGEHPFWSWFVWRDEIINSCQESLAGAWLLNSALGTPIVPAYLRAMGASVGRDVWCETLAITEFDLVTLGDGSAVNRHGCIETHLFHDRLMRIGSATVGAGATIGPGAAILPDSVVGDGTTVGGRSAVMRGEQLPAGTRWHGVPVRAA